MIYERLASDKADDSGRCVAIVIPCYNAERTLAATLESALAQGGVAETIVVDDGSDDRSLAIARSCEPVVRVLTGPNRGASAARNRGIAETKAPWLLFLDADDRLASGTIEARVALIEETQADVIICDWEESVDDGKTAATVGVLRSIDWRALEADAELATATHVWATTAAIMYKRTLVEKIGGFRQDLPIIQDARFLFDAAYHGARFVYSPHMGAQYRITPGSLSRRVPAKFWQDVFLNGRQIEALWRARGSLRLERAQAVADIYDNAARGLFAAGHPSYFEAVEAQRKLGLPLPRHSRVASPLARLIGLRAARTLVGLATRT